MHDCVWMCTVLTCAYSMLLPVRGSGQELTKGMKETVDFFPVLSFISVSCLLPYLLRSY